MTLTASNQLFDAYFTAREMRGVFCDQGRVQAMLDFEAALARAQARVGVIPASAVAPIEAPATPRCMTSRCWAKRLPRSPTAHREAETAKAHRG